MHAQLATLGKVQVRLSLFSTRGSEAIPRALNSACRTLAQADRSNIHAAISSQRFASDTVRSERQHLPASQSLMNNDPQAGPWMPRIKQPPKLGTVGVLTPCCTTRLGPMPQAAQAAITSGVPCPHFARGRLRYADRLRRPRWRHGQP